MLADDVDGSQYVDFDAPFCREVNLLRKSVDSRWRIEDFIIKPKLLQLESSGLEIGIQRLHDANGIGSGIGKLRIVFKFDGERKCIGFCNEF